MILADHRIEELALKWGMITPFCSKLESDGIISYGLTSYGYDARIDTVFKFPKEGGLYSGPADPKKISEDDYNTIESDYVTIPAHGFILARTVERFKIPRNVLALCLGKSTYARCGVIINVTPLEPEWEGRVTLELSNTTGRPRIVYANEGVCQFIFFESGDPCQISYKDRNGKYQGQEEVTLPKLLK